MAATEAPTGPWYAALHYHASAADLVDAGINLLPLSRAARDGDVAAVRALLDAGTQPDEPGAEDCYAPLHWACCYGRIECVQALLAAGTWRIPCSNFCF